MTSKITDINNVDDLVKFAKMSETRMIILCGYDNVGKGKILKEIQSHFLLSSHSNVYRPDYEYWSPRLPQPYRWTIFMSFLDVLNTFKDNIHIDAPLIFDRSALCGAVYNNDASIARDYAEKVKSYEPLHVLVTCGSRENYEKLLAVRGSSTNVTYEDYLVYTERYRCYLESFELPYVEIVNIYDEESGDLLSKTCEGCSHFKYMVMSGEMSEEGLCDLHKIYIPRNRPRCDQTSEPDIQDKEGK